MLSNNITCRVPYVSKSSYILLQIITKTKSHHIVLCFILEMAGDITSGRLLFILMEYYSIVLTIYTLYIIIYGRSIYLTPHHQIMEGCL